MSKFVSTGDMFFAIFWRELVWQNKTHGARSLPKRNPGNSAQVRPSDHDNVAISSHNLISNDIRTVHTALF